MTRKIAAFAVTAAALALAACGARGAQRHRPGGRQGQGRARRAGHARGRVRARRGARAGPAGLLLQRRHGRADQQVVGLFVVKNADLAGKVSEQVRQSAPKSAKLIVDGNVLVVYAPAGADRSAAVEQAVKAL